MKTITKLSYALVAALTLTLVSCSGDDNNGSTNNNNNNPSGKFISATVDGEDFETSTSFDAIAASNPNATTLTVQGSDNNGRTISLMIMNYDGEGTYNVSDMMNGQAIYITVSPVASYSSAMGNGASGEIEITSVDDEKVEGTFHFTGLKVEEGSNESVVVTDGEFRANFQ